MHCGGHFSICVIRCEHAAFLFLEGERLDARQSLQATTEPALHGHSYWYSRTEISCRNQCLSKKWEESYRTLSTIGGWLCRHEAWRKNMFVCLMQDYIDRSYVQLSKCVRDCSIMLTALIDFDCSCFPTGLHPLEKATNTIWRAGWDVQTIF